MEILTAVVFDCSTREMGLHGSHGRWRCRRQRSSMEILTAVVFDSFSKEKGLHGSHGRWRCRRQRSSMEILTAAIFDGDVDGSGLRCGAVAVRWVLSICWSSSRREMCLDCSGVGCNFPKL
ncbi:hypothetical protein Dimus_015234 [Dionaea muscipula]